MTARALARAHREDGNTLVIAVMVVGVCMSLALVGIQVALGATRGSGVDRQRVLAVDAAEAGVDSAYSAIASAGLTPPCSLSSSGVRSGPDTASYGTSITYYDAAGNPLTSPTTCALGGAVPAQALIRSTAQTNTLAGGGSKGLRTMEALVNLAPQGSNSLTKAIFSNGTLSFDNQTTITGNGGPNADLYSNSNLSCANNENFAGSVYSQGSVTMQGGCTIAGNLWATAGVSNSSAWNGSVAGFVKSGTGAISLTQGPGSVTGNLYAAGTVAHSNCPSKCFPNSSPGNPPMQPFPILRGDDVTMAAWQTGSATLPPYTVYTDESCLTINSRIVSLYAKKGTSTLLRTHCPISLTSDVVLSNDLAIFTYGGLTTGKVQLSSSSSGTPRKVHFIVPYDATLLVPCTTPTLDTDKQFSTTSDIDLFLYSPCAITYRNSSTHTGQIYSGSSVTIQNQFTMQFRAVPIVGVDASSLSTLGYTPSIVYKRETR